MTAATVAGRTPDDFKIVNENFDQIVAGNMSEGGFIAGISSQRPYDQGVAEATIGALALIGQTWAQAHLPPTRSAIIMSMEPVFAAFFAVILGGETLTWRMIVGGSLVVAAMVIVEILPGRRKIEAEVPHIVV